MNFIFAHLAIRIDPDPVNAVIKLGQQIDRLFIGDIFRLHFIANTLSEFGYSNIIVSINYDQKEQSKTESQFQPYRRQGNGFNFRILRQDRAQNKTDWQQEIGIMLRKLKHGMGDKCPNHQDPDDRFWCVNPSLQLIAQITQIGQKWQTDNQSIPEQKVQNKIMCATNPDRTLY